MCCLCSQIAGQKAGDLISNLLCEEGYIRRVAFETENFAIVPSLGPIAPGHVLLCPKKHVSSFARLAPEFGRAASGMSAEWDWLSRRLATTLETLYSAPIHRFEHGSGADGSHIACTVDHAHFHFLPARVDVLAELLGDSIWEATSSDISSWTHAAGDQEYLYYESYTGAALLAAKQGRYKSQHMRQIFARALGGDLEWNWRTSPKPHIADQMYRDIAQAMG